MPNFPHADWYPLIAALIVTLAIALFLKDFTLQLTAARLNARIAAQQFNAWFGGEEESVEEHLQRVPDLKQTNTTTWD